MDSCAMFYFWQMSRRYKFSNNESLYFISYSVVYWIDLFVRNEYKDILLDSWHFCIREKELDVYAWCIMSSHVHMIVGSHGRPLDRTIGEMKRHTSAQLKEAIRNNSEESRKEWILWLMERAGRKNSNNEKFQLWQQDNHPVELFDNRIIQQKLDYIHENPVKAGFVDVAEAYLYSSARDYAGEQGLLRDLLIIE
jgi:REP element-mobilizing transposase RayT